MTVHKHHIVSRTGLVVAMLATVLLTSACGVFKSSSRSEKKAKNKEEAVDRLTPEERRKYEYYFLEATRQKELGQYDAAFELYRHCLAIDPDAASTLYEISQFYLFLKETDRGLAAMQRAVEMDPGNFWYKQSLAGFYQSKGDIKSTISVFEEMATQFPDKHESLMILFDLYGREQDYPNMIRTLNRLEEKEGKSEEISMQKFRIYLTKGDDENAFKEIENLAKEYPHDMRYLTILGDVYLNNGKTKEAYTTYQKVLEQEPGNPVAMLSLAGYYEKTGQKELYERQLDTLLLHKGVEVETKLDVMRQLIVQSEQQAVKDSTKIIRLFDAVLKEYPDDPQMPMLYTQYLLSKGMEEESVPVLNHIITIDPENAPARLQLLSYALKTGNKEEIKRITEPALVYLPDNLEFYYYLAYAYAEDDKDKTIDILTKGLGRATPDTNKELLASLYGMLGDAYHRNKMQKEAFAAYDSALTNRPDDLMVLNNYAYFLSVEGLELDKAEEMSYKTVQAEPRNGTFLDTYAWILFRKARYVEARIYIDEAIKNGGEESVEVVEHAGDIYFMNGEKEKALNYWKQALGMEGGSEQLKKKVEYKKYLPAK